MDSMHMNHNISNIYNSHTNQYNDNNIKHHKLHCPVRITLFRLQYQWMGNKSTVMRTWGSSACLLVYQVLRAYLHQMSASMLAILFSLKTMESLQNGVATHFQATPLFSMRTILLASSTCHSADADAWCKWALMLYSKWKRTQESDIPCFTLVNNTQDFAKTYAFGYFFNSCK